MTPKVNRSALSKKQEKSPVLNVRKNNSINTALKAVTNQNINHNHQIESPQQRKIMTNQSQLPPSFNVKQQQSSYTVTPDSMSAVSSDDDSDHINVDKLKTIRNKAAQR